MQQKRFTVLIPQARFELLQMSIGRTQSKCGDLKMEQNIQNLFDKNARSICQSIPSNQDDYKVENDDCSELGITSEK